MHATKLWLLVWMVLPGLLGAQNRDEIATAIDAANAEFAEAWNAGDAARCAAVYAEDGDVVDFDGERSEGRGAIRELIAGNLADCDGCSIEIERLSLHVVTPELVMSDSAVSMGDSAFFFAGVWQKQADGSWQLAAGRPKIPPSSN